MTEKSYDANGIKVYSALNTNLKKFCLSLYIRAGSNFETEDNNGISHLFEHMVFRNLKRKYKNFYNLCALNGIDIDAYTYKECIRFSVTGQKSGFDFASEILCSIFDCIELPKTEFEKEKKRVKAEIRESSERTTLDFFFNKIIWKSSEPEKTIMGSCKSLDRISLKKLNEFRADCLSENNFFVYVTGNASENGMNRLVARLGSIEAPKKAPLKSNSVRVGDDFFHRKCAVNIKNSYWHYVKIGFDIDSEKYSNGELDLIYSILFSGDKALVYNCLSEDNPLVYSYDSVLEQYDNIGNLHFMFEINKKHLEDSLRVIVKMFKDLKEGKYDFEANLAYEIYCTKTKQDDADGLNWCLAYNNHILKGKPLDFSAPDLGRLQLTKEQVQKAANDIFRTENLTVAIKGNKKEINCEAVQKILKELD